MKIKLVLITIIISIIFSGKQFAASLDQNNISRLMSFNERSLQFIDICVSNFGTDEHKILLKKANQDNFTGKIWYLQNEYRKSYEFLNKSQGTLRTLYLKMFQEVYAISARQLLEEFSAQIVEQKDKHANYFLKMGYRDLELARRYSVMGYNYNRFLYSNKIVLYTDAIKYARKAKRYAMRSIIEVNTPIMDKAAYKKQTITEGLGYAPQIKENVGIYLSLRRQINGLISTRKLSREAKYLLHHDDNYGRISENKASVLNDMIDELNTDDIKGAKKPSLGLPEGKPIKAEPVNTEPKPE
jgi:hypothetical protein